MNGRYHHDIQIRLSADLTLRNNDLYAGDVLGVLDGVVENADGADDSSDLLGLLL